jgi:hypothetical protein
MTDARIRPARVKDAAAISRLRVETWKAAYGGIVDAEVLAELVSDEASIERQRGYIGNPGPRTHTFVATIEEELSAGPSPHRRGTTTRRRRPGRSTRFTSMPRTGAPGSAGG